MLFSAIATCTLPIDCVLYIARLARSPQIAKMSQISYILHIHSLGSARRIALQPPPMFAIQREIKRHCALCILSVLLAAAGSGAYGMTLPTATPRSMSTTHAHVKHPASRAPADMPCKSGAAPATFHQHSMLPPRHATCNQETHPILKTKLSYSFYHTYVPCKTGFRNSETPPWSEI